jgi:hypothetical protein
MFESEVLRKIFGPKREEETRLKEMVQCGAS